MKYLEIKERVRRLRKNMTPSERILWEILRNRRFEGKKFLRQHPIFYERVNNEHFFFVADFYCAEHKLVIELDGKIHESQKEYDKERDLIIKDRGLNVLRIKNEELIFPKLLNQKSGKPYSPSLLVERGLGGESASAKP